MITAPAVDTIEAIEPPDTPPSVKSPNATVLSVMDVSIVTAICVVERVCALLNTGEFASTPGADPATTVAARVLDAFELESIKMMLYGKPSVESSMSVFPSTTV